MKTYRIILCFITVSILLMPGAASAEEAGKAWEERFLNEPYIRLLKEVVVKINRDYSYTETTHIIDKVQNDAGKHVGEITIGYEKGRQEVSEITAHTILPDGTRIPHEKLQDLNAPGNYGMYSDNRMKVVTMPKVVIGSIIDSKSVIVTSKPAIPKHFYDSFRVTYICPIKESRYRIIAPADMKLNFKGLNTSLKPKVEASGDQVIYTWESFLNEKDEFEEFMPSYEETVQNITVSTLSDWKDLATWAHALYRKHGISTPEIRKKTLDLTDAKTTMKEKIRAIVDYLQTDFRYISMNMESHSYEPHPAAEIHANKYGDCKDQTLLAITMLSEIGIKAWPALVSTRGGFVRTDLLPMPNLFDHVIIAYELDGKRHFLDVLVRGYDFGVTPSHLSGKRVFVVNEDGGVVAELDHSDSAETVFVTNEQVTVREDGNAVVEGEMILPRGFSILIREKLRTVSADEREKFFSSLETSLANGGRIVSKEWRNVDTAYSRISLFMTYEHQGLIQKVGDMMMFGRDQADRSNLFVMSKRRYPIKISMQTGFEGTFTYNVPEGYEILNLPGKINRTAAFATFVREYEVKGSRISGREVSTLNPSRVPVEEYKLVQNFYDDLPRLTNDKIMIRKKAAYTDSKQ